MTVERLMNQRQSTEYGWLNTQSNFNMAARKPRTKARTPEGGEEREGEPK
jgi:hypothetical protein